MWGSGWSGLFKGLVAVFCIVSIISLALIYFIPAPPSKVVMATAFKGASFEYYGRQYRDIFARFNVKLELRETAGESKMSRFCRIQNPAFRLPLCRPASRMENARRGFCR
jgi:hypothetical protein